MTDTVLLWNARLIDGRGGAPVEAASVEVTVADGRIASIGTSRGEPPAGRVVDGTRTAPSDIRP